MLKVQHSNYYQQKLQNNYFQPKVLLLAQPLPLPNAHLGTQGTKEHFEVCFTASFKGNTRGCVNSLHYGK